MRFDIVLLACFFEKIRRFVTLSQTQPAVWVIIKAEKGNPFPPSISERKIYMSVTHITKSNFNDEVLQAPGTVLLDFWASWCGPCRMLSPVVDEIAAERPDVKVCKVNVDEEPELAQTFGVASIPTLVVMRDGRALRQSVGVRPKSDILAMLNG